MSDYKGKDAVIITVSLLVMLAAPYWMTGIMLWMGVL